MLAQNKKSWYADGGENHTFVPHKNSETLRSRNHAEVQLRYSTPLLANDSFYQIWLKSAAATENMRLLCDRNKEMRGWPPLPYLTDVYRVRLSSSACNKSYICTIQTTLQPYI